MNVFFDWPGRSDGKKADPKTVHAFVVANGAALDVLGNELPRVIRGSSSARKVRPGLLALMAWPTGSQTSDGGPRPRITSFL
jgi:hypothetical protein